MTPADDAFLGDFFRSLRDDPLEHGDPRYIELYQRNGLELQDPILILTRTIEWSAEQTVQLFTGFRGTGKTTQLARLRRRLESKGYVVIHIDVEDYISVSMPVDVSDFLIVVTGAFSDAAEAKGLLPEVDTYWSRLKGFLTIRPELSEITPEIGLPGAAKIGLKVTFKSDPTFRQRLQERMAGHLGALVEDIRDYLTKMVSAITKQLPNTPGVVLLVDSCEHIRGTSVNAEAVQASVETLFAGHAEKLHLPRIHTVYTVPPYLNVRYPGIDALYSGAQVLHAVTVCKRSSRTAFEPGMHAFRDVARARGDWERLLGDVKLLDELILRSGGHLRDFLRLMAAVVRRAERLPVGEPTVRSAIQEVGDFFLPIPDDDAVWLDRIAVSGELSLETVERLPRLATFLDTHLVLCYRNGEEWFDAHPLIRDVIAKQVARKHEPRKPRNTHLET